MSSYFALRSRWTMPVTRDSMWAVIEDLLASSDPMRWWPSVRVISYDGDVIVARAKSHLGYTLHFTFADLAIQPPRRLEFTAAGDLDGRGVVSIDHAGADGCHLDIDWQVQTTRTWMRRTAWALRPVFVFGHHLVMRQGRRRLVAWVSAV